MKPTFKILRCLFLSCLSFAILICFLGILLPIINETFDDFNRNLPRYLNKVEYVDGGFGDFIKYKEFYYEKNSIYKFEENEYFKKVDNDDIILIDGYFKHFEDSLRFFEHKDEYNFKKSQIKSDDYFYVESKGDYMYDNYDVYYVDTEKCIMYYIHLNI